MSVLPRVEAFAARANAWLDRHHLLAFAVAGLLIAATTVSMAASKPLWHDEIYTVLLARLGATDLWAAHRSGVDLSAPLNTLLTHVAISVLGTGPVVVRLFPLLGYWLAVVVIFAFVRRRSNTVAALIAVLLSGFTGGYRYAYEARGYGLMMGFAAVAVYAWAEAAAGRRRRLHIPLLAVALAAGYWVHYYSVFAAVPVIAGELARTARTRKRDSGIWVAVGLSFAALIPLIPLIRAGASSAPNFWGRATLWNLFPTYAFLLNALVEPAFLAGTLVLVIWAAVHRGWFTRPPRLAFAFRLPQGTRELPGHELTALLVSVALPLIQILTALVTTGVFVTRYALPAIPGLCIAIALAVVRLAPTRVVQVAIAGVLAASFAVPAMFPPSFPNPARQRRALMALLARERPVAVTGGLMYLQLWYYTPPEMRRHLYYIAHTGAARHLTGSDSIDRGLIGLAKWSELNVAVPRTFVTAHPDFFVYNAGSGWLVQWLRDDYAHVEQIGVELDAAILSVQIPR